MIKKIFFVLSVFSTLLMMSLLSLNVYAQAEPTMETLITEGDEREYMLYIPKETTGPLPLVFNFHGSGSDPQIQEALSEFINLAEQHNFIVVFPTGVFTNSVSSKSWNANVEEGVDDVQFVRDMIEAVASVSNLDRNRIYTTGFSGGARISSRLACELSDVLAAAAPVAGIQYPDDCLLKRAIPILTFHGKADLINQYTVSGNSRAYWRMGVETAIDKWRQANGCSFDNDKVILSTQITKFTWTDCEEATPIQFYMIDEAGHTWPGSEALIGIETLGVTNMDINASALIWEFFNRYTLEQ